MKRREFIAGLGGLVAAQFAQHAARSQAVPVIGFLGISSPDGAALPRQGLREGLRERAYIVDQNVRIDYRWASNLPERLPALATELVQARVNVIFASAYADAAQAAKAATSSIPIVFVNGSDPVAMGLVESMNRPGGNVTGVSTIAFELGPKRLGLLRELLPNAREFIFIGNLTTASAEREARDLEMAARAVGVKLAIANLTTEDAIARADEIVRDMKPEALIVGGDPFFTVRAPQVAALARRLGLPAIYGWRLFAESGGLISYGPNLLDLYRQSGVYVGKILGGTKPADLPVLQPTTFELVINLKTAKTLGLDVPPMLLARADEVIE